MNECDNMGLAHSKWYCNDDKCAGIEVFSAEICVTVAWKITPVPGMRVE